MAQYGAADRLDPRVQGLYACMLHQDAGLETGQVGRLKENRHVRTGAQIGVRSGHGQAIDQTGAQKSCPGIQRQTQLRFIALLREGILAARIEQAQDRCAVRLGLIHQGRHGRKGRKKEHVLVRGDRTGQGILLRFQILDDRRPVYLLDSDACQGRQGHLRLGLGSDP